MSISYSDIGLYASANMPNDETSTQGGAVDTGIPIFGTTVGEVITPPITSSNPEGGLDRVHRKKYFIRNDNVTDSFYSVQVYVPNLLTNIITPGVVTAVGASVSNTETLLYTGLDNTGTPAQETKALTGTTPVSTTTQFSYLQTVEVVGDTAVVADVTFTDHGSNVLGKIPGPIAGTPVIPGYHSATSEIEIGLAPSKNDSATSANSLTNPAGVTFSKPNDVSTALTLPGNGNLDALEEIGVWIRLTTKAGLLTRTDIEFGHTLLGTI